MAIEAEKPEGTFEIIPAGTHVARCYRMVHIGTIEEEWMGKKKLMNKVQVAFELPLELREFDKEKGLQPMYISKKYTLSLGDEANLRKDLRQWRGKDFTEEELKKFDITKLVGVPCMITVIHKTSNTGKDYALISTITGLPKGMTCPEQINPSFIFDWSNYSQEKFDALHEKTQEVLKTSQEYKKMFGGVKESEPTTGIDLAPNGEEISDLPF